MNIRIRICSTLGAFLFFSLNAFNVRVLVDKRSTTDASKNWTFSSQSSLCIKPLAQNTFELVPACYKKITVTSHDASFRVNGKEYFLTYNKPTTGTFTKVKGSTRHFLIKAENEHTPITWNNREYYGFFACICEDDMIMLINIVPGEQYVEGVLSAESWPGWPLEVNKAFAIMCRTYALYKVIHARAKKKQTHLHDWYDLLATNIHQTYHGLNTNETIKQAVEQTANLIITYQGAPIEAMYDCCCGGIITADCDGVNFNAAPYLARSYPCTYCKQCKLYAWEKTLPLNHIITKLNATKKLSKKITTYPATITVKKRDRAGRVKEVLFKGRSWSVILSGEEMYQAFKNIRSKVYSVHVRGNHAVFDGKGYGHHLGVCQWGAREMEREGYNHRGILSFYYPKTKITKISSQSHNA